MDKDGFRSKRTDEDEKGKKRKSLLKAANGQGGEQKENCLVRDSGTLF